jgi:C4-dicarboxylate-specific signal transduction histidine kinase
MSDSDDTSGPRAPALRLVGVGAEAKSTVAPVPPAQVAHELNNLLDGGLRNLSLALGHLHQAAAAADADTLRRLDAAAEAFGRMSGLLHRWMRHESTDPLRVYWTPGAFGPALRSVARLLKPVLESQRITLETRVDPRVEESPVGPLQPVLANALRNALEAIGADGSILLIARRHADQIEVQIADTGPGVDTVLPRDPDGLPRPGATTKEAGHGEGLALSRQILTALGGSIRLADRPEGGAMLTLRWSAAKILSLDKELSR